MIIYFDGYCNLCTTSSTVWKKLDWRHRLTFTSFRELKNYPTEMEKRLHVHDKNKWYKGFQAIIQIAKMLPLLWIVLPFLYVFKWINLGDYIYDKIAKSRKIVPVGQCGGNCIVNTERD